MKTKFWLAATLLLAAGALAGCGKTNNVAGTDPAGSPGTSMDRAAVAQVLASGSGGSRAAAILSATGFDSAGLRGAVPLLSKDVSIMAEVARTKGAGEPESLIGLSQAALDRLRSS